MQVSCENLTELITTKDGITFQLSSNHIYVYLPDNELLIFQFRKSNGQPYFEIPWREDLSMLVKLIKQRQFQNSGDEVYIKTLLKTHKEDFHCYVPFDMDRWLAFAQFEVYKNIKKAIGKTLLKEQFFYLQFLSFLPLISSEIDIATKISLIDITWH
ncbi:MAG: hypothetical protein JWP69_570 [Flaviaesturariibacter sp.]|nr:hypothetical protein [Flaviaesturariibacter sp.]